MKQWSVVGSVHGSKYLGTYVAETAEEAVELAMAAKGHVFLCNQCSGECEDAEVVRAEADEEAA